MKDVVFFRGEGIQGTLHLEVQELLESEGHQVVFVDSEAELKAVLGSEDIKYCLFFLESES